LLGPQGLEIDDKQSRLEALQSEVERLTQTLDKANAKTENANAERNELQTKLDQANSVKESLMGHPSARIHSRT
jgi:SMC interacting uncharacterized protein involved in chromosome segregation